MTFTDKPWAYQRTPSSDSFPSAADLELAPPYIEHDQARSSVQHEMTLRRPPSSLDIYKEEESPGGRPRIWLCTWGVLVFHLVLVITGAWALFRFIDQQVFPLERGPRRASQTDINTILSAALRIYGVTAGYIGGSNCWRAAYIMLEKQGTTLEEFNLMITWRTLSLSSFRNKGYQSWAPLILLVLLASGPVSIVSPLAGGSITWVPATELTRDFSNLSVPQAGAGFPWSWYWQFPGTRHTLVQQAAGRAASMFGASRDDPKIMRRFVPALTNLPTGSVVSNITVPFMDIHSFEWIKNGTDDTGLMLNLTPIVTGIYGGQLNVSTPYNPLNIDTAGNAALLRNGPSLNSTLLATASTKYPPYPILPAPLYNTQTFYVAILLDKVTTSTTSCASATRVFGTLKPELAFIPLRFGNDRTSCYIIAKIKFTAGVATCIDCPLVSSGVIEGSTTHGGLQNLTLTLRPEPLADIILSTIPEVMQLMATANNSLPMPYNNLENYTRAITRRAYMATWTQLQEFLTPFNQFEATQSTTTRESVPVLRGFVSKRRIEAFLAAHGLLLIGGLLVMILQGKCERRVVVDPVAITLMMDVREVVDELGGLTEDYGHEIMMKRVGRVRMAGGKGTGWKLIRI